MFFHGVNIGGWMVLEPWITPSLFYQFLGKTLHQTAMDMYSFCEILGPFEANRQLRKHWFSWFTEKDVIILKSHGIKSVRIPIGDYMFQSYGPYDILENNTRCIDGSVDYLDYMLKILNKNGYI